MPGYFKHIVDELHERTKAFQSSQFSEKLVDFEQINEQLIMQIIREQFRSEQLFKTTRAYIDGNSIMDTKSRMLKHRPYEDLSLQEWCTQLFGKERFCMVVGRMELSEYLTDMVLEIGAALKSIYPDNLYEIKSYAIAGNYLHTPLGIHNDRIQHDNSLGIDQLFIHFHLGPGTKTMYTMNNNLFFNLNGGHSPNFDFGKTLSFADSHELKGKSVFGLTPNSYHCGSSPDYSVGLIFCLCEFPMKEVIKLAIRKELNTLNDNLFNRLDDDSLNKNLIKNIEEELTQKSYGDDWLTNRITEIIETLNQNFVIPSYPS